MKIECFVLVVAKAKLLGKIWRLLRGSDEWVGTLFDCCKQQVLNQGNNENPSLLSSHFAAFWAEINQNCISQKLKNVF